MVVVIEVKSALGFGARADDRRPEGRNGHRAEALWGEAICSETRLGTYRARYVRHCGPSQAEPGKEHPLLWDSEVGAGRWNAVSPH